MNVNGCRPRLLKPLARSFQKFPLTFLCPLDYAADAVVSSYGEQQFFWL